MNILLKGIVNRWTKRSIWLSLVCFVYIIDVSYGSRSTSSLSFLDASDEESNTNGKITSVRSIQEDMLDNKCKILGNSVVCSNLKLKGVPQLPAWVDTLDLSSNDLGDNINETMSHLGQLKDLKLNKNQLTKIPLFTGLISLSSLSLIQNSIEVITMDAILALPHLHRLDLSKNLIKSIDLNSFPTKNGLTSLNLNNNLISVLYNLSFKNLKHLSKLKLNNNKISSIPQKLFVNLEHLRQLELNNNSIEEIYGLTFSKLAELRLLKLRHNKIRVLMDGAFHGLTNISLLELDNNEINVIEKAGLFNLTSLKKISLSNNLITHVAVDGWEFCQRLEKLDLSNNQLTAVQKHTFDGLTKLKELNLRGNKITSVAEGAFNSTPSLQTLFLSNNLLSWTIEDMKAPFSGLRKLERFYLTTNKFKSINQNAFNGLDSLLYLDLSDNNITTVQVNAFEQLHNLKELVINTSSLLCDCNLQGFYLWLKDSQLDSLGAVCGYPLWLKGKLLHELQESNFTCNELPKPQIIEEPKGLLALKGTNVTLNCTATASSTSRMVFQWKRDNVELPKHLITVRETISLDDNSTIATSELKLFNITQEHAGRYQCVVTNQFGVTYSLRNKVVVGTYPSFQKFPQNVTVNSGSTARLDCAANGEPRPQIAWQKDGGNDFPAARERRMHVMPTDIAFFIINAKISDTGVYTCTAENAAGIIKANATLIVYEAPSFVKPMENKEVTAGSNCVLECMASGSPKPILRWLKDGNLIEATERHFFTAEDQLLIIVDTLYSDAGTYECEMRNDLGQKTGSMNLNVVAAKILPVVNADDMMGIVIITVVCCAVCTSIIWVVIIYQTRKKNNLSNFNGSGSNHLKYSSYEAENGNGNFEINTDENINTQSKETLQPLFTHRSDNIIGTGGGTTTNTSDTLVSEDDQDLSSSNDSGTGDSAKRSSNIDLPAIFDHSDALETISIINDKERAPKITYAKISPTKSDNNKYTEYKRGPDIIVNGDASENILPLFVKKVSSPTTLGTTSSSLQNNDNSSDINKLNIRTNKLNDLLFSNDNNCLPSNNMETNAYNIIKNYNNCSNNRISNNNNELKDNNSIDTVRNSILSNNKIIEEHKLSADC